MGRVGTFVEKIKIPWSSRDSYPRPHGRTAIITALYENRNISFINVSIDINIIHI